MVDLSRGFWIRDTGTGHQVAQLRKRYMMMMMIHTYLLEKIRSTWYRVRTLAVGKRLTLLYTRTDRHWGPTEPPLRWVSGFLSGGKQAEARLVSDVLAEEMQNVMEVLARLCWHLLTSYKRGSITFYSTLVVTDVSKYHIAFIFRDFLLGQKLLTSVITLPF